MNYKEKYEEAFERAKDIYNDDPNSSTARAVCEQIFPELEESEDEKIRKEILNVIHQLDDNTTICGRNYDFQKWITWLEKQGEQIDYNEELKKCKENPLYFYDKYVKIKIKEQKLTNKIEPKFKVGNWITNNCNVWCIENIHDGLYDLKGQHSCVMKNLKSKTIDDKFHLWTIQDAKDGDVLCYEDEVFILKNYVLFHKIVYHCCYDGKNLVSHSIYSLTKDDFNKIHHATEEQRDLLFSKMKEAGYEWDTEKKELKKIDARKNLTLNGDLIQADCMLVEQSAWSEEDEKMLNDIIEDVMPCGECPDYPTDEERDYFYEGNRKVNWLKSLKEKYTWKPSDEQMATFWDAISNLKHDNYKWIDDMKSLYYDLKKLRKE